jgi:steroid 5-alpha reductase family enzyme
MKNLILFIALIILAFCIFGLVFPFVGGFDNLPGFLTTADALLVVVLCALAFALCSFVFGLITGDYSWVDRLWSILPVIFVWYYAFRGGFTPALCTIAALVTIWGCRLSFNFARRGGYTGEEDYRWGILRGRIKNRFLWQLFNLFFICTCQIGMFILFTWPVYSITKTGTECSPLFCVFAVLAFIFICIETIADQMQWNFHSAKKAAQEGKTFPQKYITDVKNGFMSRGLFRFSRHPHYFGELGFWWSVWFMALSLVCDFVQSGFFGPLMLTVLFIGSTIFTESITGGKYPPYKEYKARTSPIIPWFAGKDQDRKK